MFGSLFRKFTFIVLVLVSVCAMAQNSHDATDWKPLAFLIGSWQAKPTGNNVQGSGTYSFQPEMRGHFLVRHSETESCKGPADYDCQHQDILYVYQEPGPIYKAIYFDNEGHVIHYTVTTPVPLSAVFLSDESTNAPQFRLSYQLTGATMNGKFEIKPPGQAQFQTYLEWSGAKK